MLAIVEVLTAAGVLLNTWLLIKLNGKFDRLEGRVDTLETAHNAHVNAPGIHSIPASLLPESARPQ